MCELAALRRPPVIFKDYWYTRCLNGASDHTVQYMYDMHHLSERQWCRSLGLSFFPELSECLPELHVWTWCSGDYVSQLLYGNSFCLCKTTACTCQVRLLLCQLAVSHQRAFLASLFTCLLATVKCYILLWDTAKMPWKSCWQSELDVNLTVEISLV